MILFLIITATISLLWAIVSACRLDQDLDQAALASLFAAVLSLGGLMLAELSRSPDSAPMAPRTPAVSSTAPQLAPRSPSDTP